MTNRPAHRECAIYLPVSCAHSVPDNINTDPCCTGCSRSYARGRAPRLHSPVHTLSETNTHTSCIRACCERQESSRRLCACRRRLARRRRLPSAVAIFLLMLHALYACRIAPRRTSRRPSAKRCAPTASHPLPLGHHSSVNTAVAPLIFTSSARTCT
jgi:hypothetical protein